MDPTDPSVPLTHELLRTMTPEQRFERERRRNARLVALDGQALDDARAHIADVGLERAIAEVAAWIRALLNDPATTAPAPLLSRPVADLWRSTAEDLHADGFRRAALAERYVLGLLRYDLDLRARFALPPAGLYDVARELLYVAAGVTAEQLAHPADRPWPPRRRRRARRP